MAVAVGSSVTQVPAPETRSGITRQVLNYVQAVSDPDLEAAVHDAINGGIDLLNSRMWWWNIKEHDITLAADTDEYTINSNFKKPISLFRMNSSSKLEGRLRWKEPKVFFDEHAWNRDGSNPWVYTVITPKDNAQMTLNAAPNSDFVTAWPTLRFKYAARVGYLNSDDAELDTPPEFRSLVMWYARWEFASQRGKISETDRAERAYLRWMQRLVTDDNDTMTDWDT